VREREREKAKYDLNICKQREDRQTKRVKRREKESKTKQRRKREGLRNIALFYLVKIFKT